MNYEILNIIIMRGLLGVLIVIIFRLSANSQSIHMSDTLFLEKNRDKIVISPDPIEGGGYFKIKFPEREVFKNIELMDSLGEKINSSPILF